MNTQPQKVIFLDRDGTINVDDGYVHKIEDWKFTPNAVEALKLLQDAGFTLAVITNQSGIGHDLHTEEDVHVLHDFMVTELSKHDISFAVIAYCPHHREAGCECRKPGIGMAKQIEQKIGPIDYANSWTIGDKEADVGFGKNAGTKTALIRSRYWTEGELKQEPDTIVNSLAEAANQITANVQA